MMALALAEARKGWGRTSPNPMVGAVVSKKGRVISKGYHARVGGPHAEVAALDKAGGAAKNAELHVTLEPCHHFGRTPPCTKAILNAGIARVVIGHPDPNPKVKGGGADYLASKGVDVKLGVLQERASILIEFFKKHITTGLPFVILKSAATLDGKIATSTGHSRWVTGEKARRLVHHFRAGVDAIVVGRGTVEHDDPSLNTRLPSQKKSKNPVRIILDTHLKLPTTARVFDSNTGGPTIVACGPKPNRSKTIALNALGVDVWPLSLVKRRVSLADLVKRLGAENLTSLLIEGGAEVSYQALVEEKIVDKVLFFYAPKIVGGRDAPTLVGGTGVRTMDESLNLEVIKIRRLGPDILVESIPRY